MTITAAAPAAGRGRRLLITTGAVGAAAAALLAVTATEASASSLPVKIGGTSVSQRDCYHPSKQPYPSTSCSLMQTIPAGTPVVLVCQEDGQNISGDVWWDYVKTLAGVYGYVSDFYVNTGTSAYRVPGVDYCNY